MSDDELKRLREMAEKEKKLGLKMVAFSVDTKLKLLDEIKDLEEQIERIYEDVYR